MSTNPSTDPIPYRKDLRKKMGIKDQDSENANNQKESSNNEEYNKSID